MGVHVLTAPFAQRSGAELSDAEGSGGRELARQRRWRCVVARARHVNAPAATSPDDLRLYRCSIGLWIYSGRSALD